jgi:general secretion pathway protein H
MVVLLIIALSAGLVSLALRDGSQARLEREALRLAAFLEAGRAEARASGLPVRFELAGTWSASAGDDVAFRFVGLPTTASPAGHWLEPAVQARIVGARALRLGPEPMIGAQRIVLSLGERELELATDGLSPFTVQDGAAKP